MKEMGLHIDQEITRYVTEIVIARAEVVEYMVLCSEINSYPETVYKYTAVIKTTSTPRSTDPKKILNMPKRANFTCSYKTLNK